MPYHMEVIVYKTKNFVASPVPLGAPFVNLNLFKKDLIEKTQDF